MNNSLLLKLVDGLNPQQRLAVTHSYDKNTLVIAGAGSGKTSVLTRRIAFIVGCGYSTDDIVAVTFTNKAADEIRKRVGQYIGVENAKKILMGTFHSVSVELLRKFGREIGVPKWFVIYDTKDAKQIMKEVVKELLGSVDKEVVDNCVNNVSKLKNEMITYQQAQLTAFTSDDQFVAMAYERYQNKLSANRALDFDDLIMKTVNLLSTSIVARDYCQKRFKFVMCDESQDTNAAQYALLELIAGPNNIFLVGDDGQSIYGWRGAKIDNIIRFQEKYPNSNIIKLEQNYRSTQTIVNASNAVIKHNRKRLDKTCFSMNDIGEPVKIFKASDDTQEARFIVREIMNLHTYTGKEYKNFAVLCRVNRLTRTIEDELMRYGIPYRVVSGLSFYQRKEIKDTVAMMKSVVNPDDDMSFERFLKISPSIGDKTIQEIKKIANTLKIPMREAVNHYDGRAKAKLQLVLKHIKHMGQYIAKPVSEFIQEILDTTGYVKRLKAVNTPENQERIENIGELFNIATEFEGLHDKDTITEFLDRMTLSSDSDGNKDDNCVKLMTIHSSKGLEFDTVFVMGVEETLLPHKNCASEAELEEERRLLYVAMTRAEKLLYITHTTSRMSYGKVERMMPSRFLSEIPIDLRLELF